MTDRIQPVMFRWKQVDVCVEGGEVRRTKVMVPHARFMRLCERQFELEDDYPLGPAENAPSRGRAAIFATVHDVWDNLPDTQKAFPSEEHLRKTALVKAGWADHSQTILDTPGDAKKFGVMVRKVDAYAIITISGNVVDVWTARSIATGRITSEEFKPVKLRALKWLDSLVGLTPEQLEEARSMS